jgi:RNA polymerase sigma-70 factor (ECF subfamily)
MPASDEQLMLAYAGGDAAAFEALYARHKGPLFRFVLRSVKGQAQAEELFQEVWMRAIEARARYRPEAKFSTWLYTIAHNRLVDHWRAKGLALVSLDDEERAVAEPVAPPGAEPHANLEASRSHRRVAARATRGVPAAPGRRSHGGRDRGGDVHQRGSGEKPAAIRDEQAEGGDPR